MQIKLKAFNRNCIPKKANPNDAGFDCFSNSFTETDSYIEYGLGFSLEIPKGYVGLLFPRSSISKYDLTLANSVGVIDPDYRDEVKARFKRVGTKIYEVGERVCQLIIIPLPDVSFSIVEELDNSNNRNGGFGSTGV